MKNISKFLLLGLTHFLVFACNQGDDIAPINTVPEEPKPGIDIVRLPVVVHVIHSGEEVGIGSNLSTERVQRQIEILNEDFRKKAGTTGYNEHPDGADTRIEFLLARSTPESKAFDGINRINALTAEVENLGYNQNHYAQYAYWEPGHYINIWTTPLPLETECLVLGSASGPSTDLPGTHLLSIPQQGDADGILINWMHFGESDIGCHARYGRTLTHEMGHFLGLLHTWGGKSCEFNDYCEDTPAIDEPVFGGNSFEGCAGEIIMIGNYMNYSDDAVMNIFTNDQAKRIHYVLSNHTGRKSLMASPALK